VTSPADTVERVRVALARVIDPEIRRPITELDMIGGVVVDPSGVATVDLKLTIVGCPAADSIERDVRAAAATAEGVSAVEVAVSDDPRGTRRADREAARWSP